MDAQNHLIIGLIVGTITAAALMFLKKIDFAFLNMAFIPLISLLYSLLPDIDHKSGTATWMAYGTGLIFLILGFLGLNIPFLGDSSTLMIAGIITLVGTFCLAMFAGHRGFVHTIWFGALAAAALYLLLHQWTHCIIAFMAFYSHLCADGLWDKLY